MLLIILHYFWTKYIFILKFELYINIEIKKKLDITIKAKIYKLRAFIRDVTSTVMVIEKTDTEANELSKFNKIQWHLWQESRSLCSLLLSALETVSRPCSWTASPVLPRVFLFQTDPPFSTWDFLLFPIRTRSMRSCSHSYNKRIWYQKRKLLISRAYSWFYQSQDERTVEVEYMQNDLVQQLFAIDGWIRASSRKLFPTEPLDSHFWRAVDAAEQLQRAPLLRDEPLSSAALFCPRKQSPILHWEVHFFSFLCCNIYILGIFHEKIVSISLFRWIILKSDGFLIFEFKQSLYHN